MKRFWTVSFLLTPLNLIFFGFLVLLLLFLVNALVYKYSPIAYSSRAFISLSDFQGNQGLNINFDLSENEKKDFENWFAGIGVKWQGERVSVQINKPLYSLLKGFDGLGVGLKVKGKKLELTASLKKVMEMGLPTSSWLFASLSPEESWLYLEAPNLKVLLPEELRAITPEVSSGLVVFTLDNDFQGAWMTVLPDSKKFADDLATLIGEERKKVNPKATFTEGVIETVKTFNFISSLSPMTGGVIGDKLVVATGDEAFRQIVKVSQGQKPVLANATLFSKNRDVLGKGVYLAYFQPGTLSPAASLKNLTSFSVGLDSHDWGQSKNLIEKISTFGLVVTDNRQLIGVLNLK